MPQKKDLISLTVPAFTTYYKNDLAQNNQGITGNELNRVYADTKRPIIWIATQRDGLNAYNYNEQTFTAYQHNPENPHSLITNDVTDISPSTQHDDGLWISTYYRGIEYLDITSGQFTHYNKKYSSRSTLRPDMDSIGRR